MKGGYGAHTCRKLSAANLEKHDRRELRESAMIDYLEAEAWTTNGE